MVEVEAAPNVVSELGQDIERELRDGLFNSTLSHKFGHSSRVLAETSRLSLLPTISPLDIGHCLVFSKQSLKSFASFSAIDFSVRLEIAQLLAAYVEIFGDALVFEHGMSADSASTACGVTRAHFHLFPVIKIDLEQLIVHLTAELGAPESRSGTWPDATYRHGEYISLGSVAGATTIWQASNIPSQLVRRHIAAQLNLNRWDWRELFGWSTMAVTASSWHSSTTAQ
jgi:diadenosine tetraphosphate (Ap4A) HIT family hydrolase